MEFPEELHRDILKLVDDEVGKDDFRRIKAYCKQWITSSKIEKIKYTHELLAELERLGVISCGDYTQLYKILDVFQLIALKKSIQDKISNAILSEFYRDCKPMPPSGRKRKSGQNVGSNKRQKKDSSSGSNDSDSTGSTPRKKRSTYQPGPQRQMDKKLSSAKFQSSLSAASQSVAKINWVGVSGTGWLVGSALRKFMITNHHVIKESVTAEGLNKEAQFFYDSPEQSGASCLYANFKQKIYSNEELDVAIIELDLSSLKSHTDQELPEPMKRFRKLNDQDSLVHLVGHPDGHSKDVDFQCRIIPYTDEWYHARLNRSLALFNENKYPHINDSRRVHYDTSPDFIGGSSGCPGFLCDIDHQAAVAFIHAFQLPDVKFPEDFPPEVKDPLEYLGQKNHFEQGIRIEFVYDWLQEADAEICNEVFPNGKPQ